MYVGLFSDGKGVDVMPPDGRLIDVLLNEELRVISVKRLIRAFKSDSEDIITTIEIFIYIYILKQKTLNKSCRESYKTR